MDVLKSGPFQQVNKMNNIQIHISNPSPIILRGLYVPI